MTIQSKTLYSHIGASGGVYSIVEHYDDVTGAIDSFDVTVPAGQTLSFVHTDNVTKWTGAHSLSFGTSAPITVPNGVMLRTIPVVQRDPRLSYSFQPSD